MTSTLCHNSKSFPELPLKETSTCHFKNQYQCTIKEQLKSGDGVRDSIKTFPTKPMGKPLLIGDEADR